MRRNVVTALALMGALAWPVVAQQGPGPGPGAGRLGRRPDIGVMVDALAQRIGLTDAEKAATRKAMEAKREAATALGQELRALAQVVSNKQSKDEELTAALKKFDAARTAYRQKVKDIDAQLAGAVSLRARAALTVAGVIDNGFGARFGGMRAGGARAGGARGFAPRTGARGAAGQ